MTAEEKEKVEMSLFEKMSDKSWKLRSEAYQTLEQQFKANDFTNVDPFLGKIEEVVVDNNATAQENALLAVLSYFEKNGDDRAREIGRKIVTKIGEKGLVGRAKGKERTLELYNQMVEIGLNEEVFAALCEASKHKNIKMNSEAIKAVENILRLFGVKIFCFEELTNVLKEWVVHRDKESRQGALRIVHFLVSELGDTRMTNFVNTIPPAQKKDYDVFCSQNPFKKTEVIRNVRDGVILTVAKESLNKMEEEKVVERVKIVKILPPNFFVIVRGGKWKEKRDALNTLNTTLNKFCGVVESVEEVKEELKKLITENNVVVCSCAMKTVEELTKKNCDMSTTYRTITEHLKESNKNIVNTIIDTFVNVLKNYDEVIELLNEVKGTSVSNMNVMLLSQKLLEKFKEVVSNKVSNWADLFSECLQDQRKESRDEATKSLMVYVQINGFTVLDLLHNVSEERLKIVRKRINGEVCNSENPSQVFPTDTISETKNMNFTINLPKKMETVAPNKVEKTGKLEKIDKRVFQGNSAPNIERVRTLPKPELKRDGSARPVSKGVQRYTKPTKTNTAMQPVKKEKKLNITEILRNLKSSDWKRQITALEDAEVYLKTGRINTNESDILVSELKTKITDPKRALATVAIKTLNALVCSIKVGFQRHIAVVMPSVIVQLGETNKQIKENAKEVMISIGNELGLPAVMGQLYNSLYLNNNPSIRKSALEVLDFFCTKMDEKEAQVVRNIIVLLMRHLNERNLELRKLAEGVVTKMMKLFGTSIFKERVHELNPNETSAFNDFFRRSAFSGLTKKGDKSGTDSQKTRFAEDFTEKTGQMEEEQVSDNKKMITKKLTHLIKVCRDSVSQPVIRKSSNDLNISCVENMTKAMEEEPTIIDDNMNVVPMRKTISNLQQNGDIPEFGKPTVSLIQRCATISMVVKNVGQNPVIVRSQTMIPTELLVLYKIPDTYIKDVLRLGAEMLPQDYLQRLISLSQRDVDLCLTAVNNLDVTKTNFEEFIMTWGCILLLKGDFNLLPKFCLIVRKFLEEKVKNGTSLENVRSQKFVEYLFKSAQYFSSEIIVISRLLLLTLTPFKLIEILWKVYTTSHLMTRSTCLMVLNNLFDDMNGQIELPSNFLIEMFFTIYSKASKRNNELGALYVLGKLYNEIGRDLINQLMKEKDVKCDHKFDELIRCTADYLRSRQMLFRTSGERKSIDDGISDIEGFGSIGEQNMELVSYVSGVDSKKESPMSQKKKELKEMSRMEEKELQETLKNKEKKETENNELVVIPQTNTIAPVAQQNGGDEKTMKLETPNQVKITEIAIPQTEQKEVAPIQTITKMVEEVKTPPHPLQIDLNMTEMTKMQSVVSTVKEKEVGKEGIPPPLNLEESKMPAKMSLEGDDLSDISEVQKVSEISIGKPMEITPEKREEIVNQPPSTAIIAAPTIEHKAMEEEVFSGFDNNTISQELVMKKITPITLHQNNEIDLIQNNVESDVFNESVALANPNEIEKNDKTLFAPPTEFSLASPIQTKEIEKPEFLSAKVSPYVSQVLSPRNVIKSARPKKHAAPRVAKNLFEKSPVSSAVRVKVLEPKEKSEKESEVKRVNQIIQSINAKQSLHPSKAEFKPSPTLQKSAQSEYITVTNDKHNTFDTPLTRDYEHHGEITRRRNCLAPTMSEETQLVDQNKFPEKMARSKSAISDPQIIALQRSLATRPKISPIKKVMHYSPLPSVPNWKDIK
ncbi:hypothetical protein EIN_498290 [Entamoeba invadens IP1]|uniref:TOG domain-containing protein n=1 Tax=Entamoeba invadens IP1 TaxID=370355 RepID=A0A0A1UDV8_ENTIV|nr:hypothetical protein EIN_498290 [Entamoeba invadens IP1]ELP94629.1 hypothetical protein EIN_498290 [Entamoeba invadens IP1]|eukprot:XP_004261400.1 hypothetical protein EIN_498290 [Entamoeba invadens IP1]